jgi:hypothetical protein
LSFPSHAHFVIADEFDSVGLGDTLTDSRQKARRFFKRAQSCSLDDLLAKAPLPARR